MVTESPYKTYKNGHKLFKVTICRKDIADSTIYFVAKSIREALAITGEDIADSTIYFVAKSIREALAITGEDIVESI